VSCRRPVLIVEGAGDEAAVPRLLREYCFSHGIYDFNPSPRVLKNVELPKLRRAGELERYIDYASRYDGDSVFVVLDCEDFEPSEIISEFMSRVERAGFEKPVATILFKSEFESMYIPCLPLIAEHFPEYDWRLDRLTLEGDCERVRNAKGFISNAMKTRAYKETRDQAKFLTAIDYGRLEEHSASFRRFQNTIQQFVLS